MTTQRGSGTSKGFKATAKILTLTLCAAGGALASEKKIARSALPPAVEKTVQEQSKGATIKGFSVETENGKTVYEAEMMVDGRGRDIDIAKDGTVLEVEQEVAMDAVPAAARSALTAKAAGAKIVKVEQVSSGGKVTSYEADTVKGAKKKEVAAGPNGEAVKDED